MNVLYITWGEDIVGSGIYNTQVIDQIICIKEKLPHNISVLAGIPLNRRYFRNIKLYNTGAAKISDIYRAAGIAFTTRKLPIISPYLHCQWWALPAYFMPHLSFLKKHVIKHSIDIIHCRSYQAALISILCRQLWNLDYKVVFDTRGLIPEEGLFIGAYRKAGWSYVLWKKIEKYLLDRSDAIVSVSDTFSEHLQKLCGKEIETIYTSVNVDIFRADESIKTYIRNKLGIKKNEKVLVYCGYLGKSAWHDISYLGALYNVFRKTYNSSKLLIITRVDEKSLREALLAFDFAADEVIIIPADTPADVNQLLQAGDYAALPYRQVNDAVDEIISRTMMATKTGEYLACGLPIIVNERVGGASYLIEKFGLGVSYSSDNYAGLGHKLLEMEDNYEHIAGKCRDIATRFFSSQENAVNYINIYQKLLGE